MSSPDRVVELRQWQYDELIEEKDQMRTALEQCAADFISPPCSMEHGNLLLATEFQRRMEIAKKALR
jgi:hypothetical protein